MSIDVGPDMQRTQPRSKPPAASGPWLTRVLLAVGAMVVLGAAAVWLPRSSRSQEVDSVSTHIIARGDLIVTVTEQGTLASAENTEIKCRVRGENTIIWAIESGSIVKAGDELVRLDTLAIEDAIAECTKEAHLTRSDAERAQADMARAELAIPDTDWARTFLLLLRNIAAALKAGEVDFPGAATFLDGHRTQMVIDAIRRSSREGDWTELPESG